ncbi:hypothetical protein AB0K51_20080 [Kitasatospora sp. NPDC049285]|uniref:hypothetical protein n=1 Tax=Kitasatospora sp. NPDC049285 TaxID=3157096 RepID=UPI003426173F
MTLHQPRLGATAYRVLRSATAPGRLTLHDDHHWLSLYADREGTARLVALWSLAARSPHSLIHLPLRTAPAPDTLDLVLAHHSLQFRPADWKALRARLGPGRPHTTGTPDHDFRTGPNAHERRHHHDFRDHLAFDLAAHTLFVTGSATAFRDTGSALATLLADAPAEHHRHHRTPSHGTHACTELTTGPRCFPHPPQRNAPGVLHVQYVPDRTA